MAPTPVTVSNTLPLVVDAGPNLNGQAVGFDNSLYVSVSICNPGTATCQTIDHILVDTGSSGLRILSSAMGLSLPYVVDAKNNGIGNCIQYPDTSFQWGPMALVDVHLQEEVASNIPIQIIAPSNFSGPPTACSAGGVAANTLSSLGANGILGVGCSGRIAARLARRHRRLMCTSRVRRRDALRRRWRSRRSCRIRCGCSRRTITGCLLRCPRLAPLVRPQWRAALTFGIGTQTNNALGSAVAQAATSKGTFTTTFGGVAYTNSFIDSALGAYYFLDSTTTGLPNCAANGDAAGYYCAPSPVTLTAMTSGPNPSSTSTIVSQNLSLQIWNALTLIDSGNPAFNNIGGPNPGAFAWGLPFFYGRTVFIGIEGQTTPAGTGPFWAY